MAANPLAQSSLSRTPFDHSGGILATHPIAGNFAGSPSRRTEEGTRRISFVTSGGDIGIKKFLGLVMGWHFMELATFLVKSDVAAFSEVIVVFDIHSQDGRHTGKTENHQSDKGTVSKTESR